MKLFRSFHVHSISIHKNVKEVWAAFSNPSRYGELYPNWIKSISKVQSDVYYVDDQFGNSYEITLMVSFEFGSIDLQIGDEVSSLRLFPLNKNRTLAVHVAKPWKGIGWVKWFFHKRTIAKDFINAKKIIESNDYSFVPK